MINMVKTGTCNSVDDVGCYTSYECPCEDREYKYSGEGADEKTVKAWKEVFKLFMKYMKANRGEYNASNYALWCVHFASLVVFCGVKAEDIFNKKSPWDFAFNGNDLFEHWNDKFYGTFEDRILSVKNLNGLRGYQKKKAEPGVFIKIELDVEEENEKNKLN